MCKVSSVQDEQQKRLEKQMRVRGQNIQVLK